MGAKRPPIPTEVLGTGTKILEQDGIRASLSYAYNHGARVALDRLRLQVAYRVEQMEATLRNRPGDVYLMGRVASYEYDLQCIEHLIKEYTHET